MSLSYNNGAPIPSIGGDEEARPLEWQWFHTIVEFHGVHDVVPEEELRRLEANGSQWVAEARKMNREGWPVSSGGQTRVIPRYVVLEDQGQLDDLYEELIAGSLCFDLRDVSVGTYYPAKEEHARDLHISFVYVDADEEEDN
jgi:hypothetical protein